MSTFLSRFCSFTNRGSVIGIGENENCESAVHNLQVTWRVNLEAAWSVVRKRVGEKGKTLDPAYDLERSTSFSAKEILLKRGTPARLSGISRACTRTPTNPRGTNERGTHEEREKVGKKRGAEKVEGSLARDLSFLRFPGQTDEKGAPLTHRDRGPRCN